MPISAVAVVIVLETFVSVYSPVTAEGVINSVTPLPEDVVIALSSTLQEPFEALLVHTPPVKVIPPGLLAVFPSLIAQAAEKYEALKFPLLCPNATAVHKNTAPRTKNNFRGDMFTPC